VLAVDTSVLVSMLLQEPGAQQFADKLKQTEFVVVGAPTLLETSMVLTGRVGQEASWRLDELLRDVKPIIENFNEVHWRTAREAFMRFGKGRHPARLNFGDCMAYAVARVAGAPLLYTGDNFAKTDIEAA
jgi:ribonuclease VapC